MAFHHTEIDSYFNLFTPSIYINLRSKNPDLPYAPLRGFEASSLRRLAGKRLKLKRADTEAVITVMTDETATFRLFKPHIRFPTKELAKSCQLK